MNPFLTLYTHLFNYALAVLVICLTMLVIDIVHFIYIWRNELTHYLVDTGDKQIVKKEAEDYQYLEQKDVFEVKDIKDFEDRSLPKDENDEFRITMAQNIFAREDVVEPTGKLKKKKKPKKSPLKKKEEDVGGDESLKLQEDDFNPYNLNEPL